MSSVLYSLGRFCFRRRWKVAAIWLLILAVLGGGAALTARGFDDSFTIPGTESQDALDSLRSTFPEMAYASAQIVLVVPDGSTATDQGVRDAVTAETSALTAIDHVDTVGDPYGTTVHGLISDDGGAVLIPIQLDEALADVSDATVAQLRQTADDLRDALPGATVIAGGDIFGVSSVHLGLTEVFGVIVALIVLTLTFGSVLAAGVPLLTSLLGVAISTAVILLATAVSTVSSTTPILSIMLGLAVGIDYALLILSRHRSQLADDADPEESAGVAVATAGSAVVFAGLTVVIALVGLAIVDIPFLTVMGVAAAFGVVLAVGIALTLLPAVMGMFGRRLRPRSRRRTPSLAEDATTPASARHPWATRWVGIVTRIPALTIALVVGLIVLVALPSTSLRLALPNNGTAAAGTDARVSYDLIAEHFGAGQNAPLIVTASIIQSTDPLTLVSDLSDRLGAVDGVASVALATPNQNADTAIVELIPVAGASDPQTSALVQRLRDLAPSLRDELGVDIRVTGVTAIQIDVSDRLSQAILPYGAFVVGLSLLLLMVVFRSIWVPVKATVGYLLSVAAAFGATALVFEDGWFSDFLGVEKTGPVISFLPILLMGVLFGLAMDYEVFLVARMREDYVRTGDARGSILSGFAASAQVVAAAAIIMFAVFASFVPQGEGPIKSIALSLAVGVFVDAFIIRMTLVPAVLAMLGRWAWWLPRGLARILPAVDIEGESVARIRSLAGWPGDGSIVAVRGLSAAGSRGPIVRGFSLSCPPGTTTVLVGGRGSGKTAVCLMLTGRMRFDEGDAVCCGGILPEQAGRARRQTAYIPCRSASDAGARIERLRTRRPEVVVIDDADTLRDPAARTALRDLLVDVAVTGRGAAILTAEHPETLTDVTHDLTIHTTSPGRATAESADRLPRERA